MRPVRREIGEQRLLKWLRPSVPITQLEYSMDFRSIWYLKVPLQRTDDSTFIQIGQDSSEDHVWTKIRMFSCAQFERKTLDIHHSGNTTEHSLLCVQNAFFRIFPKVL